MKYRHEVLLDAAADKRPLFLVELLRFLFPPILVFVAFIGIIISFIPPESLLEIIKTDSGASNEPAIEADIPVEKGIRGIEAAWNFVISIFAPFLSTKGSAFTLDGIIEVAKAFVSVGGSALLIVIISFFYLVKILSKMLWFFDLRYDLEHHVTTMWTNEEIDEVCTEIPGQNDIKESLARFGMQVMTKAEYQGVRDVRQYLLKKLGFEVDLFRLLRGLFVILLILLISTPFNPSLKYGFGQIIILTILVVSLYLILIGYINRYKRLIEFDRACLHLIKPKLLSEIIRIENHESENRKTGIRFMLEEFNITKIVNLVFSPWRVTPFKIFFKRNDKAHSNEKSKNK